MAASWTLSGGFMDTVDGHFFVFEQISNGRSNGHSFLERRYLMNEDRTCWESRMAFLRWKFSVCLSGVIYFPKKKSPSLCQTRDQDFHNLFKQFDRSTICLVNLLFNNRNILLKKFSSTPFCIIKDHYTECLSLFKKKMTILEYLNIYRPHQHPVPGARVITLWVVGFDLG